MTRQDYINRMFAIQDLEYMSLMELSRDLKISYNTLMRLKTDPESCLLKTMKKIKKFVDHWECGGRGD